MKTNSVLRVLAITVFAVIFSNTLLAQISGSNVIDQIPIVEERKGGTTTYSVASPGTDDYTWQVTGAVSVSPAADGGDGSPGNPFVINYTSGLTSIEVTWPADNNNITFVEGNVSVQRRVDHGGSVECPGIIQSWDVNLWSAATASIATPGFEICSGDAVGGEITVEFTGAPNFDFTYQITDVDGTTGAPVAVTGITGASTTIPLPANLVNTSSTDDQYYVITLTQMNDGFTGDGTILTSTFTITVHPTVETGPISGNRTLTRR